MYSLGAFLKTFLRVLLRTFPKRKTVYVPMNSKVDGTNSYVIKKNEYVVYFFMTKEGRKSQLTENIAQSFNLSLPKFCKT